MTWRRGRSGLAGLLIGATAVAPAAAFEIFGIHLWGERSDDDQIEIIDPLPYAVSFVVAGDDEDLADTLRNASALWTDRDTPASGVGGLLAKARGDYRRILAAAYNAGYYGPLISIKAAGQEVADLTLAADFPPLVPVAITVDPGPLFHFGRTEIAHAPPPPADPRAETPASVGYATGEPAPATVIGQASAVSIERWRQLGRAKAAETGREALADHATDRLNASIALDPGRLARFGPTRVAGSRRVDPDFIAFMADLPEGEIFDPDQVAEAQERLSRLEVFRSIRIEQDPTIGPDGLLPMTVRVEDRPPRTLGFGATLSTIEGLGLQAYWTHRNLFGRAERLAVEASIEGLGVTSDPLDYDYNLGVTFTKPGVWTPDTSFVTSLVARQLDLDTYRETSLTGRIGFSQQFGSGLTGDLFAVVSRSRFEDDFGVRHFLTFGASASGALDRRDDILDPTRGYYLAAELYPFYEAEYGNTALRSTLEGRVYFGFGAEERFVLAGRAKVGGFAGAPADESPPNLLFFAGGGGSVRGYAYRSIGIERVEPDGDTVVVGGKGLFETSLEARARFTERFGGVAFVDAGFVSADANLSGDNELRAGAGLGFRYFTGLGPLRVDVATPIDPREDDSRIALYIGIGQAF